MNNITMTIAGSSNSLFSRNGARNIHDQIADASLPNPSSVRISLPEPRVNADARGILGVCTFLIVLFSMLLLVGCA